MARRPWTWRGYLAYAILFALLGAGQLVNDRLLDTPDRFMPLGLIVGMSAALAATMLRRGWSEWQSSRGCVT